MRVCGPLIRTPEGWYRVQAPSGLGPYLRHLYFLWTHRTARLHAPMRGCHVTVAEPGLRPELDEKEDGLFSFTLSLAEPATNGNAVWLPVDCPELEPYRATKSPLHMAVGYVTQERTMGRSPEDNK